MVIDKFFIRTGKLAVYLAIIIGYVLPVYGIYKYFQVSDASVPIEKGGSFQVIEYLIPIILIFLSFLTHAFLANILVKIDLWLLNLHPAGKKE